jgi:hypothetical protein
MAGLAPAMRVFGTACETGHTGHVSEYESLPKFWAGVGTAAR